MVGGPSREVGTARDQAGTSFVGHIGPCPLNENENTVAKTDEEEDVDEEPGQPGDETRNVDASELGDCSGTADCGQATFVPVVELGA